MAQYLRESMSNDTDDESAWAVLFNSGTLTFRRRANDPLRGQKLLDRSASRATAFSLSEVADRPTERAFAFSVSVIRKVPNVAG